MPLSAEAMTWRFEKSHDGARALISMIFGRADEGLLRARADYASMRGADGALSISREPRAAGAEAAFESGDASVHLPGGV